MFFIHIMPCIFHKGIGYFIDCLGHFHCDFHLYSLGISLDISLFTPGTFIAIFIIILWRYHGIFHYRSLALSLRFHNYLCVILYPYPILGLGLQFLLCCQAYFITILESFHNYFINCYTYFISFNSAKSVNICKNIPSPRPCNPWLLIFTFVWI